MRISDAVSICAGSQEISKAYLGSLLVWTSEPPENLGSIQASTQVDAQDPVWGPSTPGFRIPDLVAGAVFSQEDPQSTGGEGLTGFLMPDDPVAETDVWMKPLLDAYGDDLDGFLMPSNPDPGTDVSTVDPEVADGEMSAFAMPTISAEAVVS